MAAVKLHRIMQNVTSTYANAPVEMKKKTVVKQVECEFGQHTPIPPCLETSL